MSNMDLDGSSCESELESACQAGHQQDCHVNQKAACGRNLSSHKTLLNTKLLHVHHEGHLPEPLLPPDPQMGRTGSPQDVAVPQKSFTKHQP